MEMNQGIMVTGGAGFIGSELVRQLAAKGEEVVIVDNLVNGRRENLEGVLSDKVKLITCDIRDRRRVAELMSHVEMVFHLACLGVRHSLHSPEENHAVNAGATLMLLCEARRAKVKRFVCVSSSEVYGTAQRVPIDENHPTFPMTVYGASKLAGESYARAFYRSYGFPVVVVRPFNSYGPRCHHEGDGGEVIPKFILRAMAGQPLIIFGEGLQTRDFSDVGDTARGILSAGFSEDVVGETINLGSGKEITMLDLAHKIRAIAACSTAAFIHESARPGDVLRLCADTQKAQDLLGFCPKVPLEEGLSRLLRWYRNRNVSPEELLQDEVVKNWEEKSGTMFV